MDANSNSIADEKDNVMASYHMQPKCFDTYCSYLHVTLLAHLCDIVMPTSEDVILHIHTGC